MAEASDTLSSRLFPKKAHNDYRGSPIALYALILVCLPLTFRGFVHFLKGDSGVNSIATIITFPFEAGTPDPNNVIYMFSSLWGGQQLINLFLFGVVLVRYRNLVPLAWLMFAMESLFRWVSAVLHPLSAAYVERTPPGVMATTGGFVLALIMLGLSLRWKPAGHAATHAEPSRS